MLTSAQKAHLHAVASCLHTIYETLIKMRFIDEDALITGPHTPSPSLLQKYHELKLDPTIIYLYSIMPYIDPDLTSARDFFQGGELFNPLDKQDVEQGRDPRYLDPEEGFYKQNGEYMYPWYTPLSGCGNHASCIVYDARGERIWVVDQIHGFTTDPFFSKDWYGDVEEEKEESNWGESDDGGWSAEGEGTKSGEDFDDEESDEESGGGSEFWSDDEGLTKEEVEQMLLDQDEDVDMEDEDEDEEAEEEEEEENEEDEKGDETENDNSLIMLSERSAIDVLCDINRWYIELKELPGQGEHNGWLDPKLLRPLYRKHGWPDNFDSRAFDIGMIFISSDKSAQYGAEEPLRKVDCYKSWLEYSDRDIRRYTQEIADADTPAAEWEARMQLWKAEERHQRNKKDLKNAQEKAARLCPGGIAQRDEDLPLWRLENLRVETKNKRREVERNDKMPNEFVGQTEKILAWERKCRKDQEALELYEAAYETAKADAERMCPSKTFQSATGIEGLGRKDTYWWIETQKELIVYFLEQIKEAQEFGERVPEEAPDTRNAVKDLIEGHEKSIERARTDQVRYEKWLEEHGNETDM